MINIIVGMAILIWCVIGLICVFDDWLKTDDPVHKRLFAVMLTLIAASTGVMIGGVYTAIANTPLLEM